MAANVTDFTTWSSTAASNQPQGSTTVGTTLDDDIRQLQAEIAKWRDGMAYGTLTVTSVGGTGNAITGNTSPAPTLTTNQKFLLVPGATNTGATTLALNSGTAKNVYAGNSALVGGELHASIPVFLEYDGTQFQLLGPVFRQATRQVFTSGSGTYTTPVGATRINVRLIGGGGGGSGSGTTPGSGGNGGNTTFSTLTGGGGAGATQGPGPAGGTAAGGDINIVGGRGSGVSNAQNANGVPGSPGGNGAFGGGGGGAAGVVGQSPGLAGATNSGGGGGGGGSASNVPGGAGGSAGGYVEKLFTAPAATYSYAVGAAGAAGTAGANGDVGGAGGSGIIIVDEWYN